MSEIQNTQHKCGFITIMGPPNAGKSTLLNALLGQKISIVTSKAQTTRNQIVGILTEKDSQTIFIDTPGLNHNKDHMRGQLGKVMREAIYQSINMADASLLILDSHLYITRPEFLERDVLPVADIIRSGDKPTLIILNKVDMFHDKAKMLPLVERISEMFPDAEIFPMSALARDGVQILKDLVVKFLPQKEAIYPEDQISTAPMRFLVAEMIREKVFERLHQEVPYSTAVEIESWEEVPEKNRTVIHALIYVGRASHKSMVLGKQGSTIKEIGTRARMDIQDLLDSKVHLELWVKVKDNWVDDAHFLRAYDLMPTE